MYRRLEFLEDSFLPTDEDATRFWVETFFFRVSGTLGNTEFVTLKRAEEIPPVLVPALGKGFFLKLSGYVASVTDQQKHGALVKGPPASTELGGILVTEAKRRGPLDLHLPQALLQMYALARYLEKTTIRGALTNGHQWRFIILHLNEGGSGGTYSESPVIEMRAVKKRYRYRVPSPEPDIIAGVLAHWTARSFVDLDETDWFGCK